MAAAGDDDDDDDDNVQSSRRKKTVVMPRRTTTTMDDGSRRRRRGGDDNGDDDNSDDDKVRSRPEVQNKCKIQNWIFRTSQHSSKLFNSSTLQLFFAPYFNVLYNILVFVMRSTVCSKTKLQRAERAVDKTKSSKFKSSKLV